MKRGWPLKSECSNSSRVVSGSRSAAEAPPTGSEPRPSRSRISAGVSPEVSGRSRMLPRNSATRSTSSWPSRRNSSGGSSSGTSRSGNRPPRRPRPPARGQGRWQFANRCRRSAPAVPRPQARHVRDVVLPVPGVHRDQLVDRDQPAVLRVAELPGAVRRPEASEQRHPPAVQPLQQGRADASTGSVRASGSSAQRASS